MQTALPTRPRKERVRNAVSSTARFVGVLLLFLWIGVVAGVAAVMPPQIGVALPLGALAAALLFWVAVKRPEIALVILAVALPFQQLIFARLFAWGVDSGMLGMARFWKEALLIPLMGKVISERIKLSRVDRLAALFLALTGAYLLIPIGPNNFYVRSIAARELVAFVLVFLIARHLPVPERASRMVENALLIAGVVLAFLAFWNHFEPDSWTRWLDSTQLNQYRATLLESTKIPAAVTTTVLAGRTFVRAGSLLGYLSLPYYLAIPVGIALARGVSGRGSRLVGAAGIVCAGGILVTITRSAIVIGPLIVLLALWMARRKVRLLVIIGITTVVLVPVAISLSLGSHLSTSFDTESGSTSIHVERLGESNRQLFQNPGGSGLGTSAATAQRFDVQGGLTNESWYFQVGTDMGFVGMACYVLFLLAVLYALFVRSREGSLTATAALCALTWISLGGIVLHTLSDLSVSWSVWMLAGIALNRNLSPSPEAEAEDLERYPEPVASL